LGQNFILDLNLTRRIAREAGPLQGVSVVEVGPGPGGLTRALLLEGAAHVTAIERDSRCLSALQDIAAHYPGALTILSKDALKVDYASLGPAPMRIVANLPYGIATPLLVGWLKTLPWPPWYDRMILMFQREVADRIVARPGSKTYGRLSVLSQWRTRPRIRLSLPPQAFTPSPKVDSALVEFVPLPAPEPNCRPESLEAITGAAFGQRRKMLKSSLRQITDDSEELLERAGIPANLRPEQLDVGQFVTLARIFENSIAPGSSRK
jgi:16S rRNA (adenine1518-N6/adenine1519-N6)-dimethyltransferase